jgi:peptide/nickel transport system substrate-binding protein
MKLGLFWSAAAAIAVSLLTPAAQAANFKWANNGDAASMDPYTRQETVQLAFMSNIYEPLARRAKDLSLEPALATSWEQTGPSTWRFHLRPNVKWQDGSAFTADDVVFSLGRIQAQSSVMRAPLSIVKSVKKIDDMTVDFETMKPDPIFPQEQTNLLIMSKAWCEAHNATEPVVLGGKDDNYAVRNAMGTGPFRLVSREPDSMTVVEKNPTWWDKPTHNLDRVEFHVISNPATRVAALLSGEMDMIYDVPPQDMARIAKAPDLKLIQGPELRTIFLALDVWRDELPTSDVKGKNPLKDKRVREAFALAIDDPAIVKRVMDGLGHSTWEMWGAGVNGYDPALDVRPPSDPAKAKALLAEAGYPNGFSIGLDCPNDRYVKDEQICTAVTSMLAKIGVKVSLLAQPKAKFFAKLLGPKYDTDFYMLGWTPSTYDAHNVLYTLLGSHGNGRGEVNYGGYSNPALDTLIDQIGVEADPAKRMAMIRQSIKILQDDVPVIPMHQQVVVWASKKNIDLVQPADNQFYYRFVNVK